MKRFVFVFAFCAALMSTAMATPVQVTVIGTSFEQAKDNGLRQAVSQHAGSIILSHRIAENGQMVHNQIVDVASGYVENWKVVRQETTSDGRVKLTMVVDVNENRIVHKIKEPPKLLDKQESEKIHLREDDTRDSYHNQRKGALRLVAETIRVYKGNYFVLDPVGRTRTAGLGLEQDFKVKWNPDFLDAFEKSIKVLNDIEDRWDEFHKYRFQERVLGFKFGNWGWSRTVFRSNEEAAIVTGFLTAPVDVCVEAVGTGVRTCGQVDPWRYTLNAGSSGNSVIWFGANMRGMDTVTFQFNFPDSRVAFASASRLSDFRVTSN